MAETKLDPNTAESDSGYRFASDEELTRLEVQGSVLGPATRMILTAAGIRPGMRVLDLGCGVGDVAFEAADLVGSDGYVVGVDYWPEAIARARLRAARADRGQVQFVEGDIHDPAPGGPFDAIVERLVLTHLADPVTVLRRQATVLRPGGLVVPIETDIHTTRSLPSTPLVSQALAWVTEAFAKAGIAAMGPRLWGVLRDAGLRPLGMIGIQPHFGPDDPIAVELAAALIRTAAPLIELTGVATTKEMSLQTFGQRLRDELQENSAVLAPGILLSAWATTGP
jgi:SAM-dependent methyltransferase